MCWCCHPQCIQQVPLCCSEFHHPWSIQRTVGGDATAGFPSKPFFTSTQMMETQLAFNCCNNSVIKNEKEGVLTPLFGNLYMYMYVCMNVYVWPEEKDMQQESKWTWCTEWWLVCVHTHGRARAHTHALPVRYGTDYEWKCDSAA